jgi:hypothetical protein
MHRKHVHARLIVAALSFAAVALAPAAATAGTPPDPFLGSWRAVDFDGSDESLSIGGPDSPNGPSNVRRVVLRDDSATLACGGGRFFGEGIGFIDGTTMISILELYCENAGTLIGEDRIDFTFHPETGTLTDEAAGVEVVWSRP